MREMCSKLIITTTEEHQLRRSGVFIIKFEQFPNIALVFPLSTDINLF